MVITADLPAMLHARTSGRSHAEACAQLEASCQRHGYGVLGSHNVAETLRSKGLPFAGESRIYEICHPGHAAAILAADPLLAAALPCRIAVISTDGSTRLSMLSPQQLLAGLSGDSPGAAAHQATAAQVEAETLAILNEAAG
jgi:uncharacterized protein (DUF302 family)